MANSIKIYEPGTPECDRLIMAAALMTAKSPKHYQYYVDVTYFDFGLNWEWTTIICKGDDFSFQALNPAEHEAIVDAFAADTIIETVDAVFADKFCPDRIEGR